MKKKWVLIGASLLLILIVFFVLLHFPQVFLSKTLDHGPFVVYSSAPLEAPEEWRLLLDSATVLLQKSELHTPEQTYLLFMASGTTYEQLLKLVGWNKPFAFAFLNRQIILAEPHIKAGLFSRNDTDYEKRSMLQLIVHEGAHCQQDKQGVKRGLPAWVNEGYAEYVSHAPIYEQPSYNLADVVAEVDQTRGEYWLRSDYGYWDSWAYKYYRVLVEYLIEVEALSIVEIIEKQDTWNPAALFEQIKGYYGLR